MAFPIHLFPLGCFVITVLAWLVTYLTAVYLNHVAADFPYISQTGTQPPESCKQPVAATVFLLGFLFHLAGTQQQSIFSQCLNLSAALAGITIYIRYMQIYEYTHARPRLRFPNKLSLFFGIASAIGMSVVANFQETSVILVHIVGAIMAFGLSICYAWIQTYISYHLHPFETGILMCHLRSVLCLVMTVTFPLVWVFTSLAARKFHGLSPRQWHPNDGGFVEHLVATISEWVMAISTLLYLVTFSLEFEQRGLTHPQLYRRYGGYPMPFPSSTPIVGEMPASTSQAVHSMRPDAALLSSSEDDLDIGDAARARIAGHGSSDRHRPARGGETIAVRVNSTKTLVVNESTPLVVDVSNESGIS